MILTSLGSYVHLDDSMDAVAEEKKGSKSLLPFSKLLSARIPGIWALEIVHYCR